MHGPWAEIGNVDQIRLSTANSSIDAVFKTKMAVDRRLTQSFMISILRVITAAAAMSVNQHSLAALPLLKLCVFS